MTNETVAGRRPRRQGQPRVCRQVDRKDLVRKVKVGANDASLRPRVPTGQVRASSDEIAIQMGMQVVMDTLSDNYIRPDESSKSSKQGEGEAALDLPGQGQGAAGRFRLLGRALHRPQVRACS